MNDFSAAMQRLLTKALLLAAPFILIAAIVLIIDPYDHFGRSETVGDVFKEGPAKKLQPVLWKVERYRRARVSRLILGDSSMASFDEDEIRTVTGERYFNFAYGGGTLPEFIDLYWMASSMTHLDAVYVGIGFINFNEYRNLDRVNEAKAISKSPLLYLSNRLVVRAAFQSAFDALTRKPMDFRGRRMSQDEIWRVQLGGLPGFLDPYRYPAEAAAGLRQVAEDCDRNGTRFVIIIPPTNVELQQKTAALGRGADVERFKAFVATLGAVYDFDYPNEFTANRDNFRDPFHAADDHQVIREVWGGQLQYSRLTSRGPH
jgi:hypothetical protein